MAALAAACLGLSVVAGCSSGGARRSEPVGGGAPPGMLTRIGRGEGRLNLLIWDGYAEDGGTRPSVDWVAPFEQQTGCRVHVRVAAGSDQMVRLAEAGGGRDWDGVSASGDVAGRLIDAGMAAPLDIGLFADYGQLWPALDGPSHTDVNGVHYGVPWMWSTDALLYDTAAVSSPPTSWTGCTTARSPGT